MALKDKKPVPNMVDICSSAGKAMVMKDMGNGHTRPLLWGSCLTLASGETDKLVASGVMGGVDVTDCVYMPSVVNSNVECHIVKDAVEKTVKVEVAAANNDGIIIDVFVFMSAAVDVDVNDYTGKRGYQTGNY